MQQKLMEQQKIIDIKKSNKFAKKNINNQKLLFSASHQQQQRQQHYWTMVTIMAIVWEYVVNCLKVKTPELILLFFSSLLNTEGLNKNKSNHRFVDFFFLSLSAANKKAKYLYKKKKVKMLISFLSLYLFLFDLSTYR